MAEETNILTDDVTKVGLALHKTSGGNERDMIREMANVEREENMIEAIVNNEETIEVGESTLPVQSVSIDSNQEKNYIISDAAEGEHESVAITQNPKNKAVVQKPKNEVLAKKPNDEVIVQKAIDDAVTENAMDGVVTGNIMHGFITDNAMDGVITGNIMGGVITDHVMDGVVVMEDAVSEAVDVLVSSKNDSVVKNVEDASNDEVVNKPDKNIRSKKSVSNLLISKSPRITRSMSNPEKIPTQVVVENKVRKRSRNGKETSSPGSSALKRSLTGNPLIVMEPTDPYLQSIIKGAKYEKAGESSGIQKKTVKFEAEEDSRTLRNFKVKTNVFYIPPNSKFGSMPLAIIEQNIKLIQEMRKNEDAIVDTLGCHALADKNADKKTYRFQILLSLLFSSQTNDKVTSATMERLKQYGCTVDRMKNIREEDLLEIIKPLNYSPSKAKHAIQIAHILSDHYDSDIPNTYEELIQLPGIGPKMSNLIMLVAWNVCRGIAVDTHVHRIANKLGWVNTKKALDTEEVLEEILPKSYWPKMNKLLVGFGQQICEAKNPKCHVCLLNKTCPSSSIQSKPTRKKAANYICKKISGGISILEGLCDELFDTETDHLIKGIQANDTPAKICADISFC
uniref:Endonuclease III homolog n=1 Tax=Rhabditophanes sp. KR3021 TaxID=114890 RepID=A0AC35TLU3_9BILA